MSALSTLPPHLKWSLATVSGCLNGAAFVFFGPLALIANLPLLFALYAATSITEAAALGAWVGFLGGIHIFGVLNYGWWIFWSFSLYTASQMTLFGATIFLFRKYVSPHLNTGLNLLYELFTPAAIWTLSEWLRTIGPVALPASYVGCIADIPWLSPLLAWANVFGGLGVSTMIALIPSALWLCLSLKEVSHRPPSPTQVKHEEMSQDTRQRSRGTEESQEERVAREASQSLRLRSQRALTGLAGLFLIGAFYLWTLFFPPPIEGDPLKIAGLQGGFSNELYEASVADPRLSVEVVETYEQLIKRAKAKKVDLMVWAESALRVPVIDTPELRERLLPQSKEEPWLIGGINHRDPDGRQYNLAISAHDQRVIGRYAKVKTVPNVESHFTPGEEWTPLPTEWGAIGVLICFESIYPEAGRALAKAGSRLLIVLSNDAGFGETPISHHMTNRAIVRAVETGRWLLRVGQAGVTTLVDPRGTQHGRLELFESGVLFGEAMLRGEVTPFVRFGVIWLWGLVFFLATPLFFIYSPILIIRLRHQNSSPSQNDQLSTQSNNALSSLVQLGSGVLKRLKYPLQKTGQSRSDTEDHSDQDPYA